jgi:AraC-like DNA-binding protein
VVVGLDLSAGQLRAAQARAPDLRLVHAAAETLPFRSETFDLVFCDHGALSWSDPTYTIPEATRVLEDVSPEYLVEHYPRHDEDVLNGTTISDIVELVQNSNEGYDWFVTSKFPARDVEGNVIGVVGVTRKLHARHDRGQSKVIGLAPAVELMLRDYSHHIGIDELAEAACLSSSEFSRSFKKHFGLSPHQYLRQIRVDAACELLATSNHCLSRIATLTGFYDQSHMTNTFVRLKGISPKRYREKFGVAQLAR